MSGANKTLVALVCCLLMPMSVAGEEILRSIDWQELAKANRLPMGTGVVNSEGPGSTLRVVHKPDSPATFLLVTLERPGINKARYAIRGRVRYEAVAPGSYLELWNHLSEGAFFSRTLASTGPMGRLEGSSGWRIFVVPFSNREGGAPPDKLVFNLVMAGPGTVEIALVELVQFANDEDLLADSTAWWSDRQAGLLGSLFGSALGILGGVVGWLGSAARAKGFVLGTLKALAWLGVAALVGGASALAVGQPYAVYYPLLLIGSISAAVGFSLPRSLNKRYEEFELRRMQALDA